MRHSSIIGGTPKSIDKALHWTERQREVWDRQQKRRCERRSMETECAVSSVGMPDATRSWKKIRSCVFLEPEGSWSCWPLDFRLPAHSCETIAVCLVWWWHVYGNLLQQPRETNAQRTMGPDSPVMVAALAAASSLPHCLRRCRVLERSSQLETEEAVILALALSYACFLLQMFFFGSLCIISLLKAPTSASLVFASLIYILLLPSFFNLNILGFMSINYSFFQ